MQPHEIEALREVADKIVATIIKKDAAYGSSWKDHGGFSAFFNLHRKYSRVEHGAEQFQFDLFKSTIELEEGEDSLEDLVAYALLTLTEVRMFKVPGTEDVRAPDLASIAQGMDVDEQMIGEPGRNYVDQDQEK